MKKICLLVLAAVLCMCFALASADEECEHSNREYVTESAAVNLRIAAGLLEVPQEMLDQVGTHYEWVSNSYHHRTDLSLAAWRCLDCGTYFAPELRSSLDRDEPHDWDENGYCLNCCGALTCQNHGEANYADTYWLDYACTIDDDQTHTISGTRRTAWLCESCGEELYSYEEYATESAPHAWQVIEGEEICTVCGARRGGSGAISFCDDISEKTCAVVEWGAIDGLMKDTFVRNFVLPDTDYWLDQLGCEPEWSWSWTQTGDAQVDVDFAQVDFTSATLYMDADGETDVTFTATVEWGGHTISESVLVHYIEPESLPEGVIIPESPVEVTVGDTLAYEMVLLPAGYQFAQCEPTPFFDYMAGSWANYWTDEDGALVMQFDEPGVCIGRMGVKIANMSIAYDVVFRVADENGNVPEAMFECFEIGGEGDEILFGIFEDDPDNGVYRDDFARTYQISRYQDWLEYYGCEPEWTWSYTCADPDADPSLWADIWDGGEGFSLFACSEVETSVEVSVECSWGESVFSRSLTIGFEQVDPLPAIANLPSEPICLEMGEEWEYELEFSPEGFAFGNYGYTEVRTNLFAFEPSWGSHTARAAFSEPGIYLAEVRTYFGNIRIVGEVTFHVADENGVVPEKTFAFKNDRTYVTFAVFEEDEYAGIWNESWVRTYWLEDEDYWCATLSGEPVWTMTTAQTGDADIDIDFHVEESLLGAGLDARANGPCEVTVTVTVEWDGHVATQDTVIRFVEPATLPTGVNTPEEPVELVVGEEYVYHAEMQPYGWTFGGDVSAHFSLVTDWGWDSLDLRHDGEYLHLTFSEPGRYLARMGVCENNLVVTREVTFLVADENGNVPELQFRFYETGAEGSPITLGIFEDDPDNGVYRDDFVHSYQIASYDDWMAHYGCEPEWTWSYTCSDPDAEPAVWADIWEGNEGIALYASSEMETSVEISVECAWGEEHFSHSFTITFEEVDILPAITNLPTGPVNLAVGEAWDYELEFSPADFAFGNFDYTEVRHEYGCDTSWGSHTANVTFYDPGDYVAEVWTYFGNIRLVGEVTFHVTDGNGGEPEQEIILDPGTQGIACVVSSLTPEPDRFGRYRRTSFSECVIANYDQLALQLDGEPVWTVEEPTGAVCVALDTDFGPSLCVVTIPYPATVAGEFTATVRCEWGGLSAETVIPICVYDSPSGDPSGATLSFGDTLVARVGEAVSLPELRNSISFNDGWSLNGVPENTSIFLGSAPYVNQGSSIVFTQSGVYHDLYLEISACDLFCKRGFTLIVTDAGGILPSAEYEPLAGASTLDLPEDLLAIEDGAFEGSAAERVALPDGSVSIGSRAFANCANLREITIPASVHSIADDAFDGHGTLFVITNSAAVRDYCLDHGLIPVMN